MNAGLIRLVFNMHSVALTSIFKPNAPDRLLYTIEPCMCNMGLGEYPFNVKDTNGDTAVVGLKLLFAELNDSGGY